MKTALITGANKGIGLSLAKQLKQAGKEFEFSFSFSFQQ
jgi:NAD(P)-dependent dehydrogenase (short-subunit alcohol dehydrogenase family)